MNKGYVIKMCSRHVPHNENYITIHLQYSVCYKLTLYTNMSANMF